MFERNIKELSKIRSVKKIKRGDPFKKKIAKFFFNQFKSILEENFFFKV
jgi:hypothetical protein